MTEQESPKRAEHPVNILGREILVYEPLEGQLQGMGRLMRALARASTADHEDVEFFAKQFDRMGILLESLIVKDGDREFVDQAIFAGMIDYVQIMRALNQVWHEAHQKGKPTKAAKAVRVARDK